MASSVFGVQRAEFSLVGELVGKREVTSEKAKDWKLHIFKIAARGSTFEVQVEEPEFERGQIDGAYQIRGNVVVEGNRTKLVAKVVEVIAAKAGA